MNGQAHALHFFQIGQQGIPGGIRQIDIDLVSESRRSHSINPSNPALTGVGPIFSGASVPASTSATPTIAGSVLAQSIQEFPAHGPAW